jgi:hypothetical protein
MKPFINLLTLSYRRRQVVSRSLRRWSLVWLVCSSAAVAAYWHAWHRRECLEQQVIAAERSAAPLERLQQEQSAMRAGLKASVAKGSVLGQMRNERPALSLLGTVSQSARRCKGRLVVEQLKFERKDRPQTEDGKSPGPAAPRTPAPEKQEPWGCVTIQGNALDNVAVATFVVGLRDSGLFRHVELKSCIRSPSSGREIQCYILECEI